MIAFHDKANTAAVISTKKAVKFDFIQYKTEFGRIG